MLPSFDAPIREGAAGRDKAGAACAMGSGAKASSVSKGLAKASTIIISLFEHP